MRKSECGMRNAIVGKWDAETGKYYGSKALDTALKLQGVSYCHVVAVVRHYSRYQGQS